MTIRLNNVSVCVARSLPNISIDGEAILTVKEMPEIGILRRALVAAREGDLATLQVRKSPLSADLVEGDV